MQVHLDFETRSEVDLKIEGLHNYARGEYTDIMCAGFGFGDEPIELWEEGNPAPMDLMIHVQSGGEVVAHNAPFELEIWNEVGVKKLGWPALRPEQVFCNMAKAYAMALPGKLENLAPALGITEQKDMEGHRIMMQLSSPRAYENGKPVFWKRSDVPEKFKKLGLYCIQDVNVERMADKRMLNLAPSERELWLLDYKINRRGIYVDTKAVKIALEIIEIEKANNDLRMRELTSNGVATCTANGQLVEWLNFQGIKTESVAKDAVIDILERKDIPEVVRQVLLLRQEAAKSSNAKLKQMLSRAATDGRVRHTAQYHGAGTGRWAGRGIQLQNVPRPNMEQQDIETVLHKMNLEYAGIKYL